MTERAEPTFTALLDWVEGRIDGPAGLDIERQIAASTEAEATVRWIREYLRTSRLMPLAEPPQELRDTLRGLFRERLMPWAPASHVDGRLDFDSRQQAVAGIRGQGDEGFQLRFRTEDLELVLDVRPTPSGEVDVHGSVRPSRPAEQQSDDKNTRLGRDVVFTSARRVRRHAVCDSSGDFRVIGLEVDVDEIWVARIDSAEQTRVEVDLRQQTI